MRVRRALAALLLAAIAATAPAGCLDLDSETAEPDSAQVFKADEEDSSFYRPPEDKVPDEPGKLIWVEPLDSPPGTDAWRILYTSESPEGETVPVSGLLVSPEDDKRKRPVVSFAHGTLGVGDTCAPSSNEDFQTLEVSFQLAPLAQQGWTAVATDYQGLGTPGVHPYLNGESEGRAVLDAARAAQRLKEAGAGSKVAAVGTSQGGHAVLFAGEIAAEDSSDLDLVGVLAFAPPSQFDRYLHADGLLFAPWMALGAGAVYGEDPAAGLDSHDSELLRRMEDACSGDFGALAERFNDQKFVKRGPFQRPPWRALLEMQEPGRRPIEAPALVIQGAQDSVVPASSTRALFDRLCAEGDTVELRIYPKAGHPGEGDPEDPETALLATSLDFWLGWLEDRFAGDPAPSNCPG